MSFPVTRQHGIHYTDLDPAWVREHRPEIEDHAFPVEIFADEVEGGEAWGPGDAETRWAKVAADTDSVPFERVVRDIGYDDWRQPAFEDVEAERRGKGHLRLDWGVRDSDQVEHYGSHDAASRALHNNTYGWELAVRDVTPSPWSRVGGAS